MPRDTAFVPALLVLLGGATFFWWIYYRREFAVSSRGLLFVMRLLALGGIVLLLWNPGLGLGSGDAPPRFVLLDRSASMSAGMADGGDVWSHAVARARDLAAPGGTRIVLLGETPESAEPEDLDDVRPSADRSSWLEGLRAAAEAGAREVVLVTDGRLEDPLGGVDLAQALGVAVVVDPLPSAAPNRGISRLTLPADVERGTPLEGRVEVQGSWQGDLVQVAIFVDGDSVTSVSLPAPVDDGVVGAGFRLSSGLAPGVHMVEARLSGSDSYPDDDRRSRLVTVDPEETGVLLVSFKPDWEARFLFPVLSQATGLPARGFLRVGADRFLPIHPGATSPVDEATLARMMRQAELLVAMGVDASVAPLIEGAAAGSGRLLLFPVDADGAALGGVGVGAPLGGEWYVEEPPPSPLAGALGDFELAGLPPLTRVLPVVDDGGGQALGVRLGGAGRPEPAIVLRSPGTRRIAVALARGFWRWGFRDGDPQDRYRRLWSAVGGWMLADEPLSAGPGVRPLESVLPRGEPTRWQGWGYEGDSVRVTVSDPSGQAVMDSVVVVPPSGTFETGPLSPGRYGFESALEADTAVGEFVVESFSGDMLRRPVDPTLLAVDPAAGGAETASRRTRPLRTSSWPYLLVLGLLCGEWTLRRRAGLR
ncbi:MAG: hypothetical protein OEO23_11650 [Gemmatimonadota bacterium]|nr:hypothetical protein [Gemmatimonadota bacterium]